jgi:predicted dehydrogenase
MTLDLHVTWAANFPTGALPASFMGFFGDQAGITFELFGDAIRVAKETQGKNVDEMVALKPRSQFADQLSDFLRATESRVVTGADMLQGRSVQAVIDAIYESSRLQKSVP